MRTVQHNTGPAIKIATDQLCCPQRLVLSTRSVPQQDRADPSTVNLGTQWTVFIWLYSPLPVWEFVQVLFFQHDELNYMYYFEFYCLNLKYRCWTKQRNHYRCCTYLFINMILDHVLSSIQPQSFLEWTRTSFE
jgi:hypothetical protein